jgi:acyl carrier protein
VEEEIRQFIVSNLAFDSNAVPDRDSPIFSAGVVDSFGMVDLLTFLGERYQVEIDTAAIDPAQLDTPARIAELVRQLRGDKGPF